MNNHLACPWCAIVRRGEVARIKAEALREAADATPVDWDFGQGVTAVEIRPWLRARADGIEAAA